MKQGIITADDVKANAERTFKHFTPDQVLRRIGGASPTYFYHYGITKQGRPEIMGPETQREAEKFASELEDGEVFELDTVDRKRATAIIKAELIRRGVDHDLALRKVKHIRR